MNKKQNVKLMSSLLTRFPDPIRVVPFAMFISIAAVLWDSWWHGSIGRDGFFIPPHDLLYLSIGIGFAALILQLLQDRTLGKGRDPRLITLLVADLAIFVAAPFDDLWHRIFGEEEITSILILWSPPHLAALLSTVVGGIALFLFITDRFRDSHFLHILQGVTVFSTAQFVLMPIAPISLHRAVGFYGSFFVSFVAAGLLIFLVKRSKFIGLATIISLLHMAIASIGFSASFIINQVEIDIPSHPHEPAWLAFFSLLLGGLIIDGLSRRAPSWLVGLLYGFATSFILYSAASPFIEPGFAYGMGATITAIVAASLGGLLGGILVSMRKSLRTE